MRVTTAFNRMLGLPGAWVRDVAFGQEAVIVTVVLRAKKPVCSGCGARGLKIKEHREKRWRALDLGAPRCVIECRLRRLYCPGCGDVYEHVPWARAGSRHTRDFEDLTAWLAQQMSQTQVTRLMRIGWETVGKILERVVADKLDHGRLDGLELIGVDEVSYGADHKFLTCVANHDSGGIVWATEGRNAASLQAFFDGLSDEQKASIKAVSIDMSASYEKAIRSTDGVPHAQVLTDTEDGDDGAMLDGDEHWERPNDRTTKAQTCVREPGPSSVPIPPAIRGRRATPSRRHAPSHRSRVSHNRGRGQPSARTPPGSEAGVRRAAVEQPAGHRDRQLPRAGAHPELRPARPDRDAERLDGVRERRSRGPRRRERRVDRVCP